MTHLIYLDNSATTRPSRGVVDIIYSSLRADDQFGNPSSTHQLGKRALQAVFDARRTIATQFACDIDELIFTSCGTEAANLAILGYFSANPRAPKRILSTRTEHPATRQCLDYLAKTGFDIIDLSVGKNGVIADDEFFDKLSDDIGMVCLTHVNNETGVCLSLKNIIDTKKKHAPDVAMYLDCIQSLGKEPIDLWGTSIDFASFSGHKIHGVKGVGLLYASKNRRLSPRIYGGEQQNKLRAGTESPYLAEAMAYAVCEAIRQQDAAKRHVAHLNAYVREQIADLPVAINSPKDASPFILNLSLEHLPGEVLMRALDDRGICVSTGAACSARSKKKSYVLQAMGLSASRIDGAIRISFSKDNTHDEMIKTAHAICDIYATLHTGRRTTSC